MNIYIFKLLNKYDKMESVKIYNIFPMPTVTKGQIKSHQSKQDKQYNGKQKKDNVLHSKLRLCNTSPQTRGCSSRMSGSFSTIGTRRVPQG